MTTKPVASTEALLKMGFSRKQLGLNNKYHPPVRRTVKLGLKDVGDGFLEASDGSIYFRLTSGVLLSKKVKMSKAKKKKAKRERICSRNSEEVKRSTKE